MNDIPMKIIEDISSHYNELILTCIDKDYNVVVHINDIDKIYKKKYLFNLDGRGLTYRDACIDYINNLMDKTYNLRYKKYKYITRSLRSYLLEKYKEYFKGENK